MLLSEHKVESSTKFSLGVLKWPRNLFILHTANELCDWNESNIYVLLICAIQLKQTFCWLFLALCLAAEGGRNGPITLLRFTVGGGDCRSDGSWGSGCSLCWESSMFSLLPGSSLASLTWSSGPAWWTTIGESGPTSTQEIGLEGGCCGFGIGSGEGSGSLWKMKTLIPSITIPQCPHLMQHRQQKCLLATPTLPRTHRKAWGSSYGLATLINFCKCCSSYSEMKYAYCS